MKVIILCLLAFKIAEIKCLGEIIYALNAGGESFTDSNGIRYRRDYLTVGTASDYGRMVDIKRVSSADKALYETERYATETFGYTIPMPAGDADYVLWLKFSEVWFNAANLKVFDVSLNDAIVVKDLDIFEKVGRGVAHDEMVEFQVRQNKIIINGKGSPFNNEIRVEFIKGYRDNPKVNAIVVMKGTIDQVPQLAAFKTRKSVDDFDEEEEKIDQNEEDSEEFENEEGEDEELKKMRMRREQVNEEVEEENERDARRKKKKLDTVEPAQKIIDPYESDDTSYLVPILVAIGAFIPLLFCLCKL